MEMKAPLSALSYIVFLQGYHKLAPLYWQATEIHDRSNESFAQTKPPSHGGSIDSVGLPE